MSFTRRRLINRTKILIDEIDQIFVDADYWNNNIRKENEALINPDPQCELKKLKVALHKTLKGEIKLV